MIDNIYKRVAEELNLPEDLVKNTYKAYWRFIRDSIESLPLKDDLDEDHFSELKTNFNIPSLGKLSCTYERMQGVKMKYLYAKQLIQKENASNKENTTDVHKDTYNNE
jgi:hypothetical protein